MKILILAAGYAVRLKEITRDRPKPLLDIGRRKIIDRIIEKVASLEGAPSIYIVTNAKFFDSFDKWLKTSKEKKRTALINDGSTLNENRLGAIKDIDLAIKKGAIDDDLLVIAGDNLFDFDLGEFLKFAVTRPDGVSVALHDIKDIESAKRFGVVSVDEKKRVVDFEEKPANPKSTLISTGIYYFPREKLRFIKEYVATSDKLDAPGYCIGWLSRRDKVHGFVFSEDWYDIGDVESYKRADNKYLEKEN